MVTKWAVGQNYYKVKNYLLKDNFRLVDTLLLVKCHIAV